MCSTTRVGINGETGLKGAFKGDCKGANWPLWRRLALPSSALASTSACLSIPNSTNQTLPSSGRKAALLVIE